LTSCSSSKEKDDDHQLLIKINPEYSKLVNTLSNLEYEALKNSIKEDGLHYPITINSKGEILDGHHRYKICTKLYIPIKYEIRSFNNSIEEKRFVIDINLKRRQLNDFQKAELAYKLEALYKEQARLRQLSKLKNVKDTLPLPSNEVNDEKGETADIISKKTGISRGTYERAKKIIEEGTEEVKEKLRKNTTKISKEYDKIRRDEKREELISQINNSYNISENNNVKLICNDFSKIDSTTIPDNSIDLIFTDPPYGEQYLYLYEDLARLAVRVLKPGGNLVFLVGHIIMDKVIMAFDKYSVDTFENRESGLKFWCPFYIKHSGNHTKIHARHVFAEGKPTLWYVKGDKVNELVISSTMSDFIESTRPSKILHDWEQSTVEAEYVIKNLTLESQTVLDPMIGSGTSGIAALKLNRKFIGIENDRCTFEMARAQLTNL
jgi:ParB-like chromosome segregation protein Spo0J